MIRSSKKWCYRRTPNPIVIKRPAPEFGNNPPRRSAFTIVGLLVVLAICCVAVIVGVFGRSLVSRYWVATQLSGQVFIVTNGRENIKLGLVGIHVVPLSKFKQIALEVVRQQSLGEQQHRAAIHQRSLDTDYVEQSFAALVQDCEYDPKLVRIAGNGREIIVPQHLDPQSECGRQLAELRRKFLQGFQATTAEGLCAAIVSSSDLPPMPSCRSAVDNLFVQLPSPAAVTDAEGRFTVDIQWSEPVMVLARADRFLRVESPREQYLWMIPLDRAKDKLLLANDIQLEECQLVSLLKSLADGGKAEIDSQPELSVSEHIRSTVEPLLHESRVIVEKSFAEAGERAAELDRYFQRVAQKASGQEWIAQTKRLEWNSGRMKRMGYQDSDVTALLSNGGNLKILGNRSSGRIPESFEPSDVIQVVVGSEATHLLQKDGSVTSWGDDRAVICLDNPLVGIVSISESLALRHDGTVVSLPKATLSHPEVLKKTRDATSVFSNGTTTVLLGIGRRCEVWAERYTKVLRGGQRSADGPVLDCVLSELGCVALVMTDEAEGPRPIGTSADIDERFSDPKAREATAATRVVFWDASTGNEDFRILQELQGSVSLFGDGEILGGIKPDGSVVLLERRTEKDAAFYRAIRAPVQGGALTGSAIEQGRFYAFVLRDGGLVYSADRAPSEAHGTDDLAEEIQEIKGALSAVVSKEGLCYVIMR